MNRPMSREAISRPLSRKDESVNNAMNNESAAVIEASHLSLRYGGVTVLDDVSLSIAPGSVVGLVGRNGAGKTTLLNCLLGLTPPNEGESRLFDCPSLALTDDVKAKLGYVAQTPELFDWLRVREQISLVGGLYPGWTEAHAQSLMLRFQLPEDMRVRKLSVGEKQRLAIVLALAHRPQLLVFDEPVASLDPVGRRDFLRSLFELDTGNGQPVTVLISSHLLEDLERVATHLVFLQNGRVQLAGSRDELAEQICAVFSERELPVHKGILHAQRLTDGTWQHTVDRRTYLIDTLPAGARVQPLGLSDLFIALNS